jgi:hypothetical protein
MAAEDFIAETMAYMKVYSSPRAHDIFVLVQFEAG